MAGVIANASPSRVTCKLVDSLHHSLFKTTLPRRSIWPALDIATRRCLSQASNSTSTFRKPKANRAREAKTSLGRVAVAADLSRGQFKKHKVEHKHVTKGVSAFCSAQGYDISKVAQILQDVGYKLDPSSTGLYPELVHVQFPASTSATKKDASDVLTRRRGDIFIFPSGTVVAWDVEEASIEHLIKGALGPAALNSYMGELEMEDLQFFEDVAHETSIVQDEVIRLGTKLDPADEEDHQANLILAKVAFSSGLARSVKVAVLERTLERYIESTQDIPTSIAKGAKLPFSRSFILRKTGELLSIRAQLNFVSELTDSLPDLFWDANAELGLESYFDQVSRALDVRIRIKVLNEKIDYLSDIVAVLRECLSERHGFSLEWLIIFLISVEVCFALGQIWHEQSKASDPDGLESLLLRYLQNEIQKDNHGPDQAH